MTHPDNNITALLNWLDKNAANKDYKNIEFQSLWYKLPKRIAICYMIRRGWSINDARAYLGAGSSLYIAYERFWQCFRYSELNWFQKRCDKIGFNKQIKIVNRNRARAGMEILKY